MRVCSSCGRQNPDDRDFCECGEYLRWEPTGFMQAVDASQAASEAPAAPEPPAASPPPPPPAAAAPPPPPPPPPAAAAPPPPPAAAAPPPPPAPAAPPSGNGLASGDPLTPAQPPATTQQPPGQPPARTTAVRAAVPAAPQAPAAPAAPAEPALASITLRVPEVEATPGETVAVGCDPGGRVRLVALVRNASGIVDNYTLAVDGLPAEWYTVAPNPVYLVPFGTAGAYEQEVEVHLHPPRSPEAEARIWNLRVTAHSAAYSREAASAPLVLGIQPYEEFEPRLKPEKASGRRRADYDVTVRNKANAPVTVVLAISDQEDVLQSDFAEREVEVPAGETSSTRLTVTHPRKIWIGRPVEHRFEVLAKTGEEAEQMLADEAAAKEAAEAAKAEGGGLAGRAGKAATGPRVQLGPQGVQMQGPRSNVRKPAVPSKNLGLESLKKPAGAAAAPQWTAPLLPTQAVYRQKPWIPRWAALLVLLLLIAAVLLFLLIPRNVSVPRVVGKKVFDAEKQLVAGDLALNPVVKEKVSDEPPGTIIDQAPAPGEKVSKNAQVSVVTAIGDGNVTMPDVVGQEFAAASTRIDKAGLSVGPVNPQPPDPKLKVKTTIPAAGEVVKEGKPVQVFLAPEKKGGGGEEGGAGGAAGGGAGGEADIVVPPIDGRGIEEYAAALGELGLVPQQVNSFTDKGKEGEVIGAIPEPGSKVAAEATVKVLVSKGIPRVAYDNDKDILLVNGFDGTGRETIAKGPSRELQPAFNLSGAALVFVSDDQLRLSNQTKPDEALVRLTGGADRFRLPSFAPTSDVNLLAALKLRDDDSGAGDLCLGRITREGWQRDCLSQPKVGFFNVLRWAPDGKAIFSVGAVERDGALHTGIYRWTSRRAFSPDASDWGTAKVVTDDSEPGKAAVDLNISPDGERMAVVANFETDTFQLYLTKAGDFELGDPDAQRLPVNACKVAWRSDSLEMVVIDEPTCANRPGEVRRVEIKNPRRSVSLGLKGDSPTYQPVLPDDGG